ncbi:metal-dependent hydrolase [Bacillus cereus]|nr:metal-dependent hydrolase [Bacillus cereus]
MMGRSHLVISTGITLSVLGLAGKEITLPVIGIAAVSGLLLDIDEPNSLLMSRALPTRFLRIVQISLIVLGFFVHFYGMAFAPWNTVLAILIGLVSFMPTRSLRNIVMVLFGIGLVGFGTSFVPWNYIIGSILVICALVPHRGVTHTVYGVIAWTILLFCATHTYGNELWIAGGLSYFLHLAADALTNRGIRPLPPFKFRLRLRLMSTGKWSGTVVESICIGLTIIFMWSVFFRSISWQYLTS